MGRGKRGTCAGARDSDGDATRTHRASPSSDVDGEGTTFSPLAVEDEDDEGDLRLVWPGRIARFSLAAFHIAVAVICVVALAYSWLGVSGVDYSAPPVTRTAAEEHAFKVDRERQVDHTAVRGMLKSASKGARCCSSSGVDVDVDVDEDDEHLTRCSNATAPLTRTTRVAIVTQATSPVDAYARYANAINAVYAAHRGYSFTVYGDEQKNLMPKQYEYRYGKVPLLLRLLRTHPKVGIFLWIDADAVILDHSYDVVSRLANKHPGKDIIGCREALISTNNVINSGTLLLRNTPWTLEFLQSWMDQPDAMIGAPDQHTFDMLWAVNHLGVREKTALLPANAFNSEPPFFETFQTPRQQPVLHLMGENVRVRASIFGRAWRGLCARSAATAATARGVGESGSGGGEEGMAAGGDGGGRGLEDVGGMSCAMNAEGQHVCGRVNSPPRPPRRRRDATRVNGGGSDAAAAAAASDWPVHIDWMMQEYASANRAVAEDVSSTPRSRVEAYNRLGVLLSHSGDYRGRLRCHEAALEIKRGQYGHPRDDNHPELAHELQVIGNHYSMFDRHEEAVDYLGRALRINRVRKDPKGDPMAHMESASLGDLASALMRAGDARQAIEKYKESLAIEIRLYGEVHKNTADTMFNMGMAYDRIGDPMRAAEYLRRALTGYETFLSPEHPTLLRTKQNLNVIKRGGRITKNGGDGEEWGEQRQRPGSGGASRRQQQRARRGGGEGEL